MDSLIVPLVLCISITVVLWIFFAKKPPPAPYPPGPKPKPFIGNALDFPLSKAPEEYVKWGRQYKSDILHFEAIGMHFVVLNKFEDAEELLERRAKKYSDRPVFALLKLMDWDYNIAAMGYNDEWRLHRRICQQNFRFSEAKKYLPIQTNKVREMLQELLDSPQNFEGHNKKLSIAIPMAMMFDYHIKSLDDPCICAADDAIHIGANLLLPGRSFIPLLPALRYLPSWTPGATSLKLAAEVRKLTAVMKQIPMQFVKERLARGERSSCLVSEILQQKHHTPVSEEIEKAAENIAFTVYGGASDTTIATTSFFIYMMAKYPEIQVKAQAEIDLVIGNSRLPEYDDRSDVGMPYVEALYREVMRMGIPLPLCAPHATSEDDFYKGYFIPKGSTIFVNLWAMARDYKKYHDPFTFQPERFLNENGEINEDSRILAYGFGRRVCVGKYVASATVWLTIVSILACFTIGKARDDSGKEIELNDDYDDLGVLRHKAKFSCSFEIRSTEALDLIKSLNNKHQ